MRSSNTLRWTFLSDLPLTALIGRGEITEITGNLTLPSLSVELYNEMFHATFCGCLLFSFLISVLPNFPSKDQICLFLKVKSRKFPAAGVWPPKYNYVRLSSVSPLATHNQILDGKVKNPQTRKPLHPSPFLGKCHF